MKKYIISFLMTVSLLTACGFTTQAAEAEQGPASIPGLTFDHSMELLYAQEFSVDYYEDGYALISIGLEGQYLVIPEGKETPEGLDGDITVLMQPLDRIYLVATSAMDFFRAIDGIGAIRLSGTKESGWYIPEAVSAMESGDMIYAGKYSAPDYERILSEGCDLAIESTMIYHNPEVKEKLEQFGIPVLVERSSYESHPLGRTEWIKLYAVLLGCEEQAEAIFAEQASILESLQTEELTGKTAAFFYINSAGMVNVRKSNDYVSKMISLAGGKYLPEDTGAEDNALSTMNMQMEEFYAKTKEADFIIYNSTIDGELETIDDLLAKNGLLADFKAVKDGNVWCTGKNLFQETTGLGTMIEDIHTMLVNEDPELQELTYMHRLK
ncbi:MAG: ABC transporter substrate-binding protein [Lachnospiraceae bacterium]|nr:ABC transporter substrate-binding protein [Lachnospiraceae bacterium]